MKRLELLQPGDEVGRYVVLDLLGQGGMAAVYRVKHSSLGSFHALKVVTVPSRSIMRRLILEGQSQARLNHRHIVSVTDVIEVDGSPGLVMEYVRGPTLQDLIYSTAISEPVLDKIARGLFRGLAAAHEAGLVHRDLKPANVLMALEEDGLVPKIADFGLAKDVTAETSATRSGSFMGTPQYMAPEQIRDARSVDHRADLFALAAVLYEMLMRRQAYPGDDLLDIFNCIAEGRRLPLPDSLPARWIATIDAGLQPDLERRPSSANEMLALWAGDVPDSALPQHRNQLDPALIEQFEQLQPAPPPLVEARRRIEAKTAHAVTVPSVTSPSLAPTHSSEAPVLVAGVGASMVLGLIGLVGLAATALLAMALWRPTTEVAQETPELTPPAPAVAAPKPPPVAPQPAPAAAPAITPPAPSPAAPPKVAPEVAPTAPLPAPAPTPIPAPPEPPMPAPEPVAPAPPLEPRTAILASGDLEVLLAPVTGGTPRPPGDVPPGSYKVLNRKSAAGLRTVTVRAGQTVHLNCVELLGRCNEI